MGKAPDNWDIGGDFVVVGSGSGALTGAIVAREHGARVTLLESTDKLGGGTAYSFGMVWIANNHHMAELGIPDSREEALAHLREISGGAHVEEVLQAYVDSGPKMLGYIEDNTGLEMEVIRHNPDYYAERRGGKMEGRYVTPKLFDTRTLGAWQPRLRLSPHFPMAATFAEIGQWGGFSDMAGWDWEQLGQRAQEGIVGFGAAVIGPLMKACLDRKVNVRTQTRARELLQDASGRVVGVRAEQDGRSISVQARRGVLLASGGYEWNQELRRRCGSATVLACTPPSNRGDAQIMALELGAAWAQLDDGAATSLGVPGEEHEGQQLYRTFNLQPARPHMVLVNREGKRFGNEAFFRSIPNSATFFDGSTQSYPNLPYFAIFDHSYKEKYAIGSVLPWDAAPPWMNPAQNIQDLASRLGIDPAGLEETLASFNVHAREGRDPVFHRGEASFDRHWGDPAHKPNAALGPIERPPFYGFETAFASAGTCGGVVINGQAQVMSVRGQAIPGLYACPNVAAHLAVGRGYTSGQTLGQSMTFGYLGALHATGG